MNRKRQPPADEEEQTNRYMTQMAKWVMGSLVTMAMKARGL